MGNQHPLLKHKQWQNQFACCWSVEDAAESLVPARIKATPSTLVQTPCLTPKFAKTNSLDFAFDFDDIHTNKSSDKVSAHIFQLICEFLGDRKVINRLFIVSKTFAKFTLQLDSMWRGHHLYVVREPRDAVTCSLNIVDPFSLTVSLTLSNNSDRNVFLPLKVYEEATDSWKYDFQFFFFGKDVASTRVKQAKSRAVVEWITKTTGGNTVIRKEMVKRATDALDIESMELPPGLSSSSRWKHLMLKPNEMVVASFSLHWTEVIAGQEMLYMQAYSKQLRALSRIGEIKRSFEGNKRDYVKIDSNEDIWTENSAYQGYDETDCFVSNVEAVDMKKAKQEVKRFMERL